MYSQTIPQTHLLNLDPRIKIALILMISLVALTGGVTGVEVYLRAIIILVPALLLLCIKKYTRGLSVLILTVIAWYGEAFVTIDGNQVATLLIFVPSGIVTRFLPSLAMGYYIFKTTQIEVLITGLERMKLSRKITIPIAVMFRFLPTIREESAAIKDAMKMRGITLKIAFIHPIQYVEYRVVPLLNSIVKIGNELTIASITRGLNLTHRRTSIISLKIRWLDWLLLILILLLCIIYYVM